MPLFVIETNLPSVPSDLAVRFAKVAAEALNKPPERLSVTVRINQQMCRGGSTDPTVTVQIYAVGVLGKEQNPTYANKFYDFFKQYLPSVCEERIVMMFVPLEPHDVAVRS
jgi:hypothetical protein